MRQPWIRALLLAAAIGAPVASRAAITVVNPAGGNHIAASNCPAGDGNNMLVPDPVVYVAPGGTPGLIAELTGGDTPFPSPPWTFAIGPALNGTLTVDTYKSRFVANHNSGGEIEVRYVRAPTDPSNLRWVQMITTNAPLGGGISPYIDPFPNDDTLPFYWTEAEDAAHSNGVTAFGAYDKHFYDFSKRFHPPNSTVDWSADLHLVSWDGANPGVVTIHDGIRWGWHAHCQKEGYYIPPCLPPADPYAGQFHALYAAGLVDLRNPIHSNFTSCQSPPPPVPGSMTTHTFDSIVRAEISVGGGPFNPIQAPATVTVQVKYCCPGPNGSSLFDTEMLQLDISGGTLPPGAMIRESPTLQSLGQTTIRGPLDLFGGTYYAIGSFFDIFTELSFDGGQTWHPTESGPGHMGLEPTVLVDGVENPSQAPVNFIDLRSENPFRGGTAKITFGITRNENVELKVYDVSGRVVKTLTNREFDAGSHDLFWDGTRDNGQRVSPGVYFYQLRTPSFVSQKKLAVLKN